MNLINKPYACLLVFLSFFALSGISQTVNEKVQLTLHLKNGDIITGDSELTEIRFETDFGNLNFPIDQVSSIKVGLKDSEFDKSYLLSLLDKIEYGNAKDKEKAFDNIVKLEEGAIPFIKAYLESTPSNNSPENADISVATAYEVMLAKYKVDRNYNIYDVVTYQDKYQMEGTYAFDDISVGTDYGKIRIKRNRINLIEVKIVNEGLENQKAFKLFANRYVSGNSEGGWLNTGILVKQGETLKMSANGQVTLASLSGNIYTPDGGMNGSAGPLGEQLNFGNVVFKVGQSGKVQKAGANYKGVANQTGIVYISIYESVFNSANNGFYNVNVRVD